MVSRISTEHEEEEERVAGEEEDEDDEDDEDDDDDDEDDDDEEDEDDDEGIVEEARIDDAPTGFAPLKTGVGVWKKVRVLRVTMSQKASKGSSVW